MGSTIVGTYGYMAPEQFTGQVRGCQPVIGTVGSFQHSRLEDASGTGCGYLHHDKTASAFCTSWRHAALPFSLLFRLYESWCALKVDRDLGVLCSAVVPCRPPLPLTCTHWGPRCYTWSAGDHQGLSRKNACGLPTSKLYTVLHDQLLLNASALQAQATKHAVLYYGAPSASWWQAVVTFG
jgi:serine/threonine protein kinase